MAPPPRRRRVGLARVAALVGLPRAAVASRFTSKRTFASVDGNADLRWWTRYFGVEDTSSSRDAGGLGDSACLTRYTAFALPDYYGVHFPTSSVTAQGGTNLTAWRDAKDASTDGMERYSSFFAGATAIWVPNLDAHLAVFHRDGVGFLKRTFTNSLDHETIYVATVASPGSFAVFEVMSAACATCDDFGDWPSYGDDENADVHVMLNSVKSTTQRYDDATLAAYSTSAGGLPAAMVVQLRVGVSDLRSAFAYAKRVWPTMALTNGSASFGATVLTGAYAAGSAASGNSVHFAFALRANASAATFDAYEAYVEAMHAANLDTGDGNMAGGGYDRYIDDHVRFEDAAVPVDAFAVAHAEHGLRYHAFNWTRSCPGADMSFPGAYMVYSAGTGAQAFELGADAYDGSVFAAGALWSLDPCAASYECRALDDDDDRFDMTPFAVFLSDQLDMSEMSALALTLYMAASASAVAFVVLVSSRVKRNHAKKHPRARTYHRIKDVVEI